MDLYFILLLVIGIALVAAVAVFIVWLSRRSFGQYPNPSAAMERVRREVCEEFKPSLEQSKGIHKAWLILKREREISRRGSQIIYGNRGV
jgi:hypothetical protein